MARSRYTVFENLEYAEAFEKYSTTVFPEFGKQTRSLYQNQNPDRHSRAVVIFGTDDEQEIFRNNGDLTLNFAVVGGADFTRFVFRIRRESDGRLLIEAVFRPFGTDFCTQPNPAVDLDNRDNVRELEDQHFNFSERMHHLTITQWPTAAPQYDRVLGLQGRHPMLETAWDYHDVVLFEDGLPSLPVRLQEELDSFKHWAQRSKHVQVFMKSGAQLIHDLKFFLSQPTPPPPPWWIFGHRCEPGEPQVDQQRDPDLVEPGNAIETKFRMQVRGWAVNAFQPSSSSSQALQLRPTPSHAPRAGSQLSPPPPSPSSSTLQLRPTPINAPRVASPPPSTNPLRTTWDGTAMFSLQPLTYYVDGRHFEVLQHSIMMRDYQYESGSLAAYPRQAASSCSGNYSFELERFTSANVRANQTCIVTIRVQGQPETKAFPAPGSTATIKLRDGSRIAGESKLDAEVYQVGDRNDPSLIQMIVVFPGGAGLILTSDELTIWRGHFMFRHSDRKVTGSKKALQMLTGSIPYETNRIHPAENWLLKLFLAQQRLQPLSRRASFDQQNFDWTVRMFSLNAKQKAALQAAVTTDGNDPSSFTVARLTITQGPPGTGKSWVIIALIVYCLRVRKQVMVTAASNQAVKVLVLRLHAFLAKMGKIDSFKIFHLGTEQSERMYAAQVLQSFETDNERQVPRLAPASGVGTLSSPSPSSSQPPRVSDYVAQLPQAAQEQVSRLLLARVAGTDRPFRLTTYLLRLMQRLSPLVFGPRRLPENYDGRLAQLIRELFSAEEREATIPVQDDENDKGGLSGVSAAWLQLQKEILSKADVVFVVADTASMRPLMWHTADLVILDEASQLKDYQVVNATARHLKMGKLQKLALFGDQAQLGPTVLCTTVSEFADMAAKGFMKAQIDRGQPHGQLTEQFRSHPHISGFVSHVFYNGNLTDHPSVLSRPWDATWYTFLNTIPLFGGCREHSIFIDVQGPHELYKIPGEASHSVANPTTASAIAGIIEKMQQTAIVDVYKDVMIIVFYSEQINLLRKVIKPSPTGDLVQIVDVRTVDSSQGDERKVVLIDFVRPGPIMGFVADMKRLCVAFSRATHGLIGFGCARMGRPHGSTVSLPQKASYGEDALYKYIARLRRRNAVFKFTPQNLASTQRHLEDHERADR
ncbi:MAG: hypothetical protein Q9211_000096 [Gyalolechia sp. 1 TL-2023]